jgi:effector-associated domain 2 (EAD2)-containing protein
VPNETPTSLRDVVEAAVDITFLSTSDGREAVLMLMHPDVVSAIPRMSTARLDIMSIVTACARYGALDELVAAIRFHAGDTTAMAHLEAILAKCQPR